MADPLSSQIHIVAVAIEAWGHTRPLANLCAKIVKLNSAVRVTLLTTSRYFDRVSAEVLRGFQPEDVQLAQFIRVIAVVEGGQILALEDTAAFKDAWLALMAGVSVTCTHTGTHHSSLKTPQAAFVDVFAIRSGEVIRELSGDAVKIFTWFSGMATALFPSFFPEHLGGIGNVSAKAQAEAQRTGRAFGEVLGQMLMPKGIILNLPGLPPMYDYELHPQDIPMPAEVMALLPRVFGAMETHDGVLLSTAESYEPEAVSALRAWYAETGRAVCACGPLLDAPAHGQAVTKDDSGVQAFLDSTLQTFGEKTLLYISFGSEFWPVSNPEALWAFLDVVMELQIPFILGHASPFALIPNFIDEKIKAYGKGVSSPWTPQQRILNHAATGWFLSHGGHNSVLESAAGGVPQIIWPFGGDQAHHGARTSATLDTGYELLEVRTGTFGRMPIHRTGTAPRGTIESVRAEAQDVLTKAFGADGARKRANLRAVQTKLLAEWEEGGESLKDVRALLSTL